MSGQDSQVRRSSSSDSPSRAESLVALKERARILHDFDHHYEDFILFAERTGDSLAVEYLDRLEELFEILEMSPKSRPAQMLIHLATRQCGVEWSSPGSLFGFREDDSIEEKLIQLVFLRRFPTFFGNPRLDTPTKIEAIENSTADGELLLQNAIKPKILDPDIIQKGYTSEYVGHDEIVTPILHTLGQWASTWQSDAYFAPYTSLVGPTMIGKSRLLMELSKEVCVVHICLRPKFSTDEPGQSQLATEMLTGLPAQYLIKYYTNLIAKILSVTVNFFKSAPANKDRKEVLKDWYEYHRSTETDFYSDVESRFSPQDPTHSVHYLLCHAAQEVGRTPLLKHTPLKVLLAIDEASALLRSPPDHEDVTLFHMFSHALKLLPDHTGVFAILVDTTCSVVNVKPPLEEDPDSRAIGSRAVSVNLYKPIYELRTFDQMVLPHPPQKWDELFSPDRLCRYGVPFFSIYLRDALQKDPTADPAAVVSLLIKFAFTKLLCCDDIADTLNITEARAIALLGPTIGVPLHGQAHLNVELTASHAAHCGYLDLADHTQFSFYPSQPIYAAAANNYLLKHEDVLISCVRHLAVVLAQDHSNMRYVGEFVSRIILLCAINRTTVDVKAAKHKTVTDPGRDVLERDSFPEPVPVAKFLEILTGLPANEVALGSLIDPLHKQKLLAEGIMFWNHFIESDSTITPASPALIFEALARGAAIHRPADHDLHHDSFQQLLPIYFKKNWADDDLDLANISFCGIHLQSQNDNFSELENINRRIFDSQSACINANNPYLVKGFAFQLAPSTISESTQ
ncbi:hypothetical protein PGTUg99_012331 [Puccinia graminis f. sp. tritici]|uniref:Uncharacterized protein n=1 Tax=Puccinia graminis f. sp. tritici TaxID=56615 RepID=A0A5B0RLY8_PUCGR|nr:hypothetical protein PGTUg99_012331 [Puccinia graminis f. sp. tritici]